MYFEHLYDKAPEEYLKMDLDKLPTSELKELSFYLWYKFPENETLMKFRDDEIMSRLLSSDEDEEDDSEDVDGE